MPRGFLLRRSKAVRRQAERDVDDSAQAITTLVALATSLADRMDAMPSAGLERDRARRDRVDVLRRAAEVGRRTLDTGNGSVSDGQRRAGG